MSILEKIKKMFSGDGKNLPIIDVNKRFDLIGRTGQGSMSKVWRARDKQTGKTVCLKVLDKVKTAKFEGRFMGLKKPSEGEICTLLRHDNIVSTFEHGLTTDKEPYIVMELVDGVGLNFLIETKSKELEGNRVNILAQYALGLDHMHKVGFLHRDICPRNVMINRDNIVKIIDFGLAVPYKPEFCKPGNRTGTANYLAPELIKRTTTDHRIDCFALGVTAFEMITGDMPWERSASGDVLRAIVNNEPRNPRELRADLDDKVVDFLLKAVERNANKRYQSPAEFRDAVMRLSPEL